jgi:hypothetical protein
MPRNSRFSNGYSARIGAMPALAINSKIAPQVVRPRSITQAPSAPSLLNRSSLQRSDLVMLGLTAMWCVYGLTEQLLHI